MPMIQENKNRRSILEIEFRWKRKIRRSFGRYNDLSGTDGVDAMQFTRGKRERLGQMAERCYSVACRVSPTAYLLSYKFTRITSCGCYARKMEQP